MFSIAHFSTNWIIFQSLHFKETALLTTNPEDPSHRNVTSLFEFFTFVSKIIIYCSCSTRMTKHTMTYLDIWPVHCLNVVVQLYFSVWFFVFIVDNKKTIIDLIVISWRKKKHMASSRGGLREDLPLDFLNTIVIFVGNKTKVWISKRVLQEKKARQIFWKTIISCPWYTHVRVFIFCFLVLHVLRFILLPYYRRIFL